MYFPYFRGKQYELITVRETSSVLSDSEFIPIIEPVKESLGGLHKAIKSVCDSDGMVIAVINPFHGDHKSDGKEICELLNDEFSASGSVSAGVLLREGMSVKQVISACKRCPDFPLTLVHAGFSDAKALSEAIAEAKLEVARHVFNEVHCGKLYRKHFGAEERVLLRDGFHRRKNREHPPTEIFSDLHATFEEEGMDGFGDFLIVGDEFSESGGPAYAVAIHLTFIDPDKDDVMYIHHFVSDTQDTPTDPAGKFSEALDKLMKAVGESGSKILETSAVAEFRELHKKGHFPGLGYVKKLSMKHHIETMSEYFNE